MVVMANDHPFLGHFNHQKKRHYLSHGSSSVSQSPDEFLRSLKMLNFRWDCDDCAQAKKLRRLNLSAYWRLTSGQFGQ